MKLTDKVAVVTGAASGIGLATCKALIAERVKAIGAVDQNATLPEVAADLNARAEREVMVPYIGTVIDDDFRGRVFEDLERRFGVVHLCVPAAGITRDRLAVKINRQSGEPDLYARQDMETVIQVNLIAPIYWAMQMVASMAKDRWRRGLGQWQPEETAQGGIVLIGSVSAAGNKGQIAYATAKAGLQGAQATLAMEAIYHGVRCAIIHPGYTDTPMVRVLGEELIEQQILPRTQLRRLCRSEEIADGICFLLRNAAVSGSLWVDAGWHPSA